MTRTFDPTTAATSTPPTPPTAAVGSYETMPPSQGSGTPALVERAQALVRSHPTASLAAAAGVGAVIGWLVKR